MIVFIKQMKAKDGMEKELEECLTASVTNVENDPDSGLAEYRIFRGEDDPQIFCTFLKFVDRDGLETYRVYSDWFLALDERTLPMAPVKGIVGSSVGALVKCRSVMPEVPFRSCHFATAVAVSPEGPERSGGAA